MIQTISLNMGIHHMFYPAEITVRTTGDIALEDATDSTHGYLVLDTAAQAGDNIDLEGATGITF